MTAVTDAIATLRSRWTSRFIDAVAVTRPNAAGTFNAVTLVYDGATETAVYTGTALIRPSEKVDRTEYGERLATGTAMDLYLPYDSTVEVEDAVEITSCTYDGDLVGKSMVIVGFDSDSYQTRRRAVCRLDLEVA